METNFNILVLYYSQTGKTQRIIDTFLEPLRGKSGISITETRIEPQTPYPFPWPKLYFFSIIPETVYEVPTLIKEPQIDFNKKYDLIILGVQVWFLSPCTPIISLLSHPSAKVFTGTPVITILFCRKMWVETQRRIEERITQLGGWVAQKILITAKGGQMQTLRASKDNLFKDSTAELEGKNTWKATSEEMSQVQRQGHQLFATICSQGRIDKNKPVFSENSLAFSDTRFMHPERVAKKSFLSWGRIIMKLSRPKTTMRYILTLVFLVPFFAKIFIGLPLWPLVRRIRLYQASRVQAKSPVS